MQLPKEINYNFLKAVGGTTTNYIFKTERKTEIERIEREGRDICSESNVHLPADGDNLVSYAFLAPSTTPGTGGIKTF